MILVAGSTTATPSGQVIAEANAAGRQEEGELSLFT